MLPPGKCAYCGTGNSATVIYSATLTSPNATLTSPWGLVSVALGLVLVLTNLQQHYYQEVVKL